MSEHERKSDDAVASRALVSVLLVAVGMVVLAVGLGMTFGLGVGLAVAGGLTVVLGLLLGWNEGT